MSCGGIQKAGTGDLLAPDRAARLHSGTCLRAGKMVGWHGREQGGNG